MRLQRQRLLVITNSGAEARFFQVLIAARLKTCPDTKRSSAPASHPYPASAASHSGEDTGLVNGAGVRPINEVPRNFPLALNFQANKAFPASLQVGHPLRSG